jgi:hypothetical protein
MHSKYAFAAIFVLLSSGLDASAEVVSNALPAPLTIVKTFATMGLSD